MRAVRVTGAQAKDWLERSAGIFNQITPGGADQPLLNPSFPSNNFDVIDGVTYQIDLSQPPKFSIKGELETPMPAASSICSSTARRSHRLRSS